jgi:hypothetical protein
MSKECEEIHKLFNRSKRLKFPFSDDEIPLNGIYVLFEKGEKAHGGDRIVRIGTHTGKGQLKSRLIQHFVNENKDRSIFRKNIGRAILNRDKDSFITKWEIDLTPKETRDKLSGKIDSKKQKEVEKKVSDEIRQNFSFVVFEIEDEKKRLELESKLISTVSLCEDCKPSPAWLGLFSPKEKIRHSGLWLVNELWKKPLSARELEDLNKHLDSQNSLLNPTAILFKR